MGIPIEFNPDLALRDISEYKSGKRKKEECIPVKLEVGKVYKFLKKEQRVYWLYGPVPLIETKGNKMFSSPKASVRILESTHFFHQGEVYTKGTYKIIKIFTDIEGKNLPYDYLQRNGF